MIAATELRVALVLAALVVGCAANDSPPAADSRPTPEYRTGSNIPVRDRNARPTTEEERERAAEQLRQMQGGSGTARPN